MEIGRFEYFLSLNEISDALSILVNTENFAKTIIKLAYGEFKIGFWDENPLTMGNAGVLFLVMDHSLQ